MPVAMDARAVLSRSTGLRTVPYFAMWYKELRQQYMSTGAIKLKSYEMPRARPAVGRLTYHRIVADRGWLVLYDRAQQAVR